MRRRNVLLGVAVVYIRMAAISGTLLEYAEFLRSKARD